MAPTVAPSPFLLFSRSPNSPFSRSPLLLFLLLFTLSCEASGPGDDPLFSRNKMLRLVNDARTDGRYCGSVWFKPANTLTWNESLEQAAKIQADDMNRKSVMSHSGSNGKFVDDRLYSVHYFWKACGENVAYGTLYEDEVMREWLNSPGHCANIMNPVYSEMGIWQTGLYWAQVFAQPQDQ